MSVERLPGLIKAVAVLAPQPKRTAGAEAGKAAAHAAPAAGGARQVSEADFAEKVRDAVEALNGALAAERRELRFTVHEGTGTTVVKVIAPDSGEVVRQIPSAEALQLAERLRAGESLGSLGVDGHS